MYGSPQAATPPRKDLNAPFQMSSGLLRYRSAPSSLLGEVCDDLLPVRPSIPETETMFVRFLSPDLRHHEIRDKNLPPTPSAAATAADGGAGEQRKCQYPPPAPLPVPAASAEENPNIGCSSAAAASQMMYNHQMMTSSSMAMDGDQIKDGAGNSSNLIRRSSSPARLFANLNVENGYGVIRGITGFRNENEGGMGTGTTTNNNSLKSQLSFSSRQSSLMSHISEMENESIGGYPVNSWEEPPILLPDNNFSPGLKRHRENQTDQTQNGEVRNGLSHQFSLPKTSSEMVMIEKFLQFQDSVPCKIRAKRGCATHPRSIAERVRRTRISERMRRLQEFVPNMDKQTNNADMLDLAVDYIKDLQKQVKTLSDSRANCTCSSGKQKPYTNPTV